MEDELKTPPPPPMSNMSDILIPMRNMCDIFSVLLAFVLSVFVTRQYFISLYFQFYGIAYWRK
jgi:hypothetical protein